MSEKFTSWHDVKIKQPQPTHAPTLSRRLARPPPPNAVKRTYAATNSPRSARPPA